MTTKFAPIHAIARELARVIRNGQSPDEVEVDGIFYTFKTTVAEDQETAYTGVEHMGARETFTRTTYKVKIAFLGAFDRDGEELEHVWLDRDKLEKVLPLHGSESEIIDARVIPA
jgi:hypothetical protein